MAKTKSLSSKELLKFTLKSLENDKGIDIVSIDLIGRSSIADYMIVVSGNTARQVTAMANNLVKKYKVLTEDDSSEISISYPEEAYNNDSDNSFIKEFFSIFTRKLDAPQN